MIDENGYISCTLCNIKYEFFDFRFGCQFHQGDLLRPDLNKILNNFILWHGPIQKMVIDWMNKLASNLA